MIREKQLIVMRAVALCFKPYLKPEEAMIYCNLRRTQLAKKCEAYGIYKNAGGYYKKDELDSLLAGEVSLLTKRFNAAKRLGRQKNL